MGQDVPSRFRPQPAKTNWSVASSLAEANAISKHSTSLCGAWGGLIRRWLDEIDDGFESLHDFGVKLTSCASS